MVNIGVLPVECQDDHRPYRGAAGLNYLGLMLGHCAGSAQNTQALGDDVLANAYVRRDDVLDDDPPVWVLILLLAEIQAALQEAVAEITGLSVYDLKRIMRTGTVATIEQIRNWELRDQRGP